MAPTAVSYTLAYQRGHRRHPLGETRPPEVEGAASVIEGEKEVEGEKEDEAEERVGQAASASIGKMARVLEVTCAVSFTTAPRG
jgi:hypothetical protein